MPAPDSTDIWILAQLPAQCNAMRTEKPGPVLAKASPGLQGCHDDDAVQYVVRKYPEMMA